MATYLNHASIRAPRTGNTAHTVSPDGTGGTVVDGSAFTPTAGRLLVCVVGGPVTATTPAGWTLPANGSAVGSAGLYVFHKTAAGSDSFATTHNGSNYPVMFDFYEFEAGSTFVASAAATGVSESGGAGPTLSGLTGTNWVAGALIQVSTSTSTAFTVSWSNGVEEIEYVEPQSGTDGYVYGLTVREDYSGATSSSAATSTLPQSAERLVFAVNVAASAPGETLTFPTVDATGWTVTGASAQAALADSDDATYVTSSASPSGQTIDLTLQPIETPTGDLTVSVRASRIDATSASIVGTLRDGGTTVATAATVNPGTSPGNLTVTFPQGNISGVTEAKWRAGTLVVRLAVTAA
jgi:hypothetical protein